MKELTIKVDALGVPDANASPCDVLPHFLTRKQVQTAAMFIAATARAGKHPDILRPLQFTLNEILPPDRSDG